MGIVKLLLHSLVMIFTCAQVCYSASLHLTWNGNTETDLAGYNVYYGTSPGSYGDPVVLGDVTEYELSGLEEGTLYYVALTAFDTSDNESEKSVEESGVTPENSSTSTTSTTTVPAAGTALHNGIEDSGTVNPMEEDLYYIDIPSGQGYLLVELTGNPDADLYVRYGSPPTLAQWDCRPYTPDSSNETCSFSSPDSGIWYIMVEGYADTVDYTIEATFNTGPPPITTTSTTPPPPPTTTTTTISGTTTTPPTTTTTTSGTTTAPTTTTTTASGTTTTPTTTTTTPGTSTTPSTTTTISATTTIPSGDTTPPTGTVIINNGIATTYSLNVILTLSAFDSGRELTKREFMSFSNDAISWSDPEPYTTAKFWTLTPGEGTKTVYAQFRDAAGNWMTEPPQDSIMYAAAASENSCEEPQKLRPVATTASSQLLPLYAKDNAVDGNPSTTWSTLFSFFKKDEFITLDLGEIKQLSWFTMQAASTLFGTDFFPVNFTIEISRDSMTWDKISTEQGYAPPIQSSHSDSWDFKNLECRYIRVYITKAKTMLFFFKMAQIAEIEVYGCNTTGSTPLLAQENASLLTEENGNPEESTPQKSGGQKELEQMPPTIPGTPTLTLFK